MARKPNYQFEKRQKELERQARKAEKLQRRLERGEEADPGITAEGEAAGPTPTQPQSDQIPGAP